MVGANEEELTAAGVSYEVGKAFYREISRGQIIGDNTDILKIMFDTETRDVLGVSILGEGASDLIHIGQAAMAHSGTIDYFVETVFNYPTLAECYKTAGIDSPSLGGSQTHPCTRSAPVCRGGFQTRPFRKRTPYPIPRTGSDRSRISGTMMSSSSSR